MLDVLLVVVLASYAVSGFRSGAIVSVLSVVGFLAGGAVGLWLGPALLRATGWLSGGGPGLVVVLVGIVVFCASLGQGAMGHVARRARPSQSRTAAHRVDSVLGAVATVCAATLLLWYAGDVARLSGPAALSRAVSTSRVVRFIDSVVPRGAAGFFATVRELALEGFPRVFDDLGPEPILPVDPPSGGSVTAAVNSVGRHSVVKVTGVASSCGKALEGSGWVVAPERVVTNAHVVAGVDEPSVQPGGVGPLFRAQVVVFDSARDLAVLAVPGLKAPAIPLGTELSSADPAVVAGFPGDGALRLGAARVRSVFTAVGADIYGQPGVRRQIYSLYTTVRPGNSGGPLLDPEGRAVGVVFARSLEDETTGYALTLEEAAPVLQRASAGVAVTTGRCLA
ncbi:MAG: MarP family serine protease [Dermatophilaceae bacterium]